MLGIHDECKTGKSREAAIECLVVDFVCIPQRACRGCGRTSRL